MKALHSFRGVGSYFKGKRLGMIAAAAIAAASGTRIGHAAPIVLNNGNSSVTLDPTSTAGVEGWTINGVNQLNQEWFWLRTGNSSGQESLSALGTPTVSLLDTTGDGKDDAVELSFGSSGGLEVSITYKLMGGQSGSTSADLTDTISITNNAASATSVDFFQYANFELADSKAGQTVSIINGNTATVAEGSDQAQTVVSPIPSAYQASSTAPSLLNEISSTSSKANLNDSATAPAGNPEFAFQWNTTIAAGSSYTISGDTVLKAPLPPVPVPEPMPGVVGLLALGGLMLRRKRAAIHPIR